MDVAQPAMGCVWRLIGRRPGRLPLPLPLPAPLLPVSPSRLPALPGRALTSSMPMTVASATLPSSGVSVVADSAFICCLSWVETHSTLYRWSLLYLRGQRDRSAHTIFSHKIIIIIISWEGGVASLCRVRYHLLPPPCHLTTHIKTRAHRHSDDVSHVAMGTYSHAQCFARACALAPAVGATDTSTM